MLLLSFLCFGVRYAKRRFFFLRQRRALPFGSAGSSSRLPIDKPFQIDDRFSDLLKHALDLVEAAPHRW